MVPILARSCHRPKDCRLAWPDELRDDVDLAGLYAAGCVVRERDGYDGSYGYDRGYERRDDDRREDERGRRY